MSRHFIPGAPPPRRGLVRVAKPRIVARTAVGPLSRQKALALAELATWPAGIGAIAGRLDGGQLSALVQHGLAERIDPDPIGGCRYRCSAAGLDLLTCIGVLHADKISR